MPGLKFALTERRCQSVNVGGQSKAIGPLCDNSSRMPGGHGKAPDNFGALCFCKPQQNAYRDFHETGKATFAKACTGVPFSLAAAPVARKASL